MNDENPCPNCNGATVEAVEGAELTYGVGEDAVQIPFLQTFHTCLACGESFTDVVGEAERSEALVQHLQGVVRELEEEAEGTYQLITRQGQILQAIANALHGGPLEDGWWSHHDLAEMAARHRAVMVEIRDRVKSVYVADRTDEADATTLALAMGMIWGAVDKALKP
jgi:hypothetical protein